MKIIAVIPGGKDESDRYVVEATELELDTIRGAAGTVKVANRYQVGYELEPASVYKQVAHLAKNISSIRSVPGDLQRRAKEMKTAVAALEANET